MNDQVEKERIKAAEKIAAQKLKNDLSSLFPTNKKPTQKILEKISNEVVINVQNILIKDSDANIPIAVDQLQAYEKIVPGVAKDLISAALEISKHRQNTETAVIDLENKKVHKFTNTHRLGMVMTFSLCTSIVVGSFYLILNGYEGIGLFIFMSMLGSVSVAKFLPRIK